MDTFRSWKPSEFSSTRRSASYSRLLLRSGATQLDYLLISLGVIFAILAGIPFPLLGIVLGDLVDNINTNSCTEGPQSGSDLGSLVRKEIIYMVIIAVVNFISLFVHLSSWSWVGERLVRRLREQYFKSLLSQELEFFDSISTGEVTSRLSEDLEVIKTGTSEKVGICITSISYFVAAVSLTPLGCQVRLLIPFLSTSLPSSKHLRLLESSSLLCQRICSWESSLDISIRNFRSNSPTMSLAQLMLLLTA